MRMDLPDTHNLNSGDLLLSDFVLNLGVTDHCSGCKLRSDSREQYDLETFVSVSFSVSGRVSYSEVSV